MAYRPYTSKRNEDAQGAIGDALLALLETKPFSAITITELCEAANVSRPTFYRHFDATEDVLGYLALRIFNGMNEQIEPLMGHGVDGRSIVRRAFESLLPFRSLFQAIKRNDLLGPLFGHLWLLSGYFPKTKDNVALENQGASPAALDMIAYSWGGTFSVIFRWISDDMQRDPQEMADAVFHAAQHVGATFLPNYTDASTMFFSATDSASTATDDPAVTPEAL